MNLFRVLSASILAALTVFPSNDLRAQRSMEINPPAEAAESSMLALVGARLIDGRGGPPIEHSLVLIQAGKILAAGEMDSLEIPSEAERLDLTGKTLVPGLIDCHFHSINDLKPPSVFLSKGVTTFRDPGHPFRFYQAVQQTDRPMPRVFLCGGHLDAYPPIWPDQAVIVNNAEEAAAAVADHATRGATAIKIYFRLPLELFPAVCQAAHERNMPVTAHLELVRADQAIDAGIDGIEHVTSLGTALAEADDASQFEQIVSENPSARTEQRYRLWSKIELDNNPRLKPLLDQLVSHHTVLSPTLAVFERRSHFEKASEFEVFGFQRMLEFVRRCRQAGVTIVVGSHTWVPGAEFGWAFHRELELLVECGMSPLEAIRAGTIDGARFLRAEERLGSLTPGKLADLVVVSGNPAEDIAHMRRVERVMLAGKWLADD